MGYIKVTTQSELDAALADDSVDTIDVGSSNGVWLYLYGNNGKSVRAFDSASVQASGSASVRAFGSASVRAFDSASVQAFDSASVQASGSASVQAFGSASVQAFDSASVRAFGSASVQASDSASVQAGSHVAVHLNSKRVRVVGGVVIDVTDVDLRDTETWAGHVGADLVDGRVTLFKAVDDRLTAGRAYFKPTVYAPGTEITAPDWEDNHHCGGGYHLSPTAHQATDYDPDAKRWLRCTVAVEDVRPIPDGGTPKAKCRTVRVEAEVDIWGRDLTAR